MVVSWCFMNKQMLIDAMNAQSIDDIEFKPFSFIEEMFIEKEYLPNYYRLKREYLQKNGQSIKGMKWRAFIHPFLMTLFSLNRKFVDKQKYVILNDRRKKVSLLKKVKDKIFNTKEKPVIFCISHIDKYDFQIVSEIIKEHQIPFAGDPETMYRQFDGFVLNLNGVIYCDTESTVDRKVGKNTAVELLESGKNLLIYPEGVWNVTANLLSLPLFPGIINMSKETGCNIVPIAIERYGKEYVVNIGEEFSTTEHLNQGLSVDEVKCELRNEIATLKWEIMESRATEKSAIDCYYEVKRKDLGTYQDELTKFQNERLSEWVNPKTKDPYYTPKVVKSRTYKEKDKYTGNRVDLPEDAFSYMSKMHIDDDSILLPVDESLPDTIQQEVVENNINYYLNDEDDKVKKI